MVVGKIKTLIFGAEGMLGTELCSVFPDAIKLKRNDGDISDRDKVIEIIKQNGPCVVINAAAYTAVDDCEDHQELAYEINGRAPGYIAEGCACVGAIFVHYSTDYIFDGREKTDNYRIIRTSWLYGVHGKNFVDTMLRLSGKMEKVKVVNDQFGKPTYAVDLARKTAEWIEYTPGIYHITNEGVCSWFEFASEIINNVIPCTSEEFPRKAKRPKYSVLVNTKTPPMRHWTDALTEYLHIRKTML
ncbi:MAG: NAD(P)-dependent oxidoreductase [Candidatus Methanoperedens sp.]|nr:NAD(P)-dependent oxidoreductase [Candidatus Methanoperedens sp.]MCE8429575.1 NAD(P)-dependent oxidoreductase [Candidatus Methanoperedens sp.]